MTREEIINKIQEMRPIDDVLFEVLMRNPKVCQEMLRVIFHDDNIIVEEVVPQAHFRNYPQRWNA